MNERYLEDFTPGLRITTPSFTLTEEELVDFAHKYDPQPYHLDREAARESVFGGLVAGGFQTAALGWALALRSGWFDACAMAGIGVDELRWLLPLRVDDTVTCHLEVLENHPSRSRPDRGVAVIRYDLTNAQDDLILTMKLTQMLRRRPEPDA